MSEIKNSAIIFCLTNISAIEYIVIDFVILMQLKIIAAVCLNRLTKKQVVYVLKIVSILA